MKVKTKVDEVKTSMEEIHDVLVRVRAIHKREVYDEKERKQGCFCQYHAACVGHAIQNYEEFRGLVQLMMNHREIEFFQKIIEDSSNVITRA